MNEQVRQYFSDHWIPMALSVVGSSIVFIISLITLYTNFRVEFFALKESVFADNTNSKQLNISQQQLLQKITQVDQKVTDDHESIQGINANIEDIHRYIFGAK
jgi:hypothetical protein